LTGTVKGGAPTVKEPDGFGDLVIWRFGDLVIDRA
jgi:hypothetical protein